MEWREVGTRRPGQFSSIWGSSPNNIWAGGFDKMYKWEGMDWVEMEIPIPHHNINFGDIRGLARDNVNMICYVKDMKPPVDSLFYYLYHFNGKKWAIQDSTYTTAGHFEPTFGTRLSVIDNVLYSASPGVYKFRNGWERLIYSDFIARVSGLNSHYLFASGQAGTIYFYNGIDWYPLEPIPGFRHYITGIWTNGREVFFLVLDGWKSFVIHGQ